MVVTSLGRKTDLIFSKFSGQVLDRGSYTLIQTPNNPGYHWGNFIIFDQPPKSGDAVQWKELFDREFSYYSEPHHYSFTWETDEPEPGDTKEFLEDGFEFEPMTVLTAERLKKPIHFNSQITIKKISSSEDWEKIVQLQTLCADPKHLNEYYGQFKRNQIAQYREMSQAGMGHWYGGYLGGQLVGDLGIYCENRIGRYQNVGTHPDFRRQGICATLVYLAGLQAVDENGLRFLVMQADPDYHAARVYKSVGFVESEKLYSLSWWRR